MLSNTCLLPKNASHACITSRTIYKQSHVLCYMHISRFLLYHLSFRSIHITCHPCFLFIFMFIYQLLSTWTCNIICLKLKAQGMNGASPPSNPLHYLQNVIYFSFIGIENYLFYESFLQGITTERHIQLRGGNGSCLFRLDRDNGITKLCSILTRSVY